MRKGAGLRAEQAASATASMDAENSLENKAVPATETLGGPTDVQDVTGFFKPTGACKDACKDGDAPEDKLDMVAAVPAMFINKLTLAVQYTFKELGPGSPVVGFI